MLQNNKHDISDKTMPTLSYKKVVFFLNFECSIFENSRDSIFMAIENITTGTIQ